MVEAVDRLRRVRPAEPGGLSVENILSYNQEFSKTLRVCSGDVLPSEAMLVDIYVANLPRQLAYLVRLREPETLPAARKLAVTEARSLSAMGGGDEDRRPATEAAAV